MYWDVQVFQPWILGNPPIPVVLPESISCAASPLPSPSLFIVFGNWTHLHISIFAGTLIDTMDDPAPYHNPHPDFPLIVVSFMPSVLAKSLRIEPAFINYCSFTKKQ